MKKGRHPKMVPANLEGFKKPSRETLEWNKVSA